MTAVAHSVLSTDTKHWQLNRIVGARRTKHTAAAPAMQKQSAKINI
jgi:hypothetical protein